MSKNNVINTYTRFDVSFEKGEGTKVYDSKGNEYLDFVSGIAVNCLGHSHPSIVKTLEQQSKELMHISNLYWNSKQLSLAERLTNYSDHDQVFFSNSGTEAVETGLKLARKYGKLKGGNGKVNIIHMENSFHGRTFGALSVTGQEKYQKPFTPLIGGIQTAKFNDIESLKNIVDENTCCIIVEPIQGEGGIIPADKEFLAEARVLCDKYDALLIFDEVQCGIGRTGKLFAYQSYGVVPDVICMAKALGGGFPIGATLVNLRAAEGLGPGDHGCTFGGNPLACAVALTVLNELVDNGIIENVNKKSEYLIQKLQILKNDFDVIKEIRGKGLLLGISLTCNPKTIVKRCFEKGLLLVTAGKDAVRILPPLNVKIEEIDFAVNIIKEALEGK